MLYGFQFILNPHGGLGPYLIDELYHAVENRFDMQNKEDKKKFEKIRAKYKKIAEEHGAEIKAVYHITRDEQSPSLYEKLKKYDKGFY